VPELDRHCSQSRCLAGRFSFGTGDDGAYVFSVHLDVPCLTVLVRASTLRAAIFNVSSLARPHVMLVVRIDLRGGDSLCVAYQLLPISRLAVIVYCPKLSQFLGPWWLQPDCCAGA
jgi:hypothetical protein